MSAVSDKRKLFTKKESVAEFAEGIPVEKMKEMREMFELMDTDQDGQLTVNELVSLFAELNVKCARDEVVKLVETLDKDGDHKISFKEFLEGMRWIKKSSAFGQMAAAPKRPRPTRTVINTATGTTTTSTPPAPGSSVPTKEPTADSISSTSRGKGYHGRSRSIVNFVQSLDEQQVAQIKELFNMCDSNGDGVVTKAELLRLTKELGMETSRQEFELLFANLDLDGDGNVGFEEFLTGMRWIKKGINFAKPAQGTPEPKQPAPSAAPKFEEEEEEEEEEDDGLQARITELEEKNKILTNYLKDVIGKALDTSKAHLKVGDIPPARALLSAIDLQFLVDMEDFVGAVVDKKQLGLYKKMAQFVKDNSPK